jgi:uncharacterized SAM-binding protein YcdF (DUF218 family)
MPIEENANPRYDAVIVLGMNIRREGTGYRPTSYEDHDEFGMLAGEVGVIAATQLYRQNITDTFVFSTGTSEKTKAAFGEAVPTEAAVYSKDFLQRLEGSNRPLPKVILEEYSFNTYSNLTESAEIIHRHPWKRVAILCARYHVPRVKALWQMAVRDRAVSSAVDFLSAEDIIIKSLPGTYDTIIEAAYASPEGQKRLKSEEQGLRHIQDGKYIISEYQFHKPTR